MGYWANFTAALKCHFGLDFIGFITHPKAIMNFRKNVSSKYKTEFQELLSMNFLDPSREPAGFRVFLISLFFPFLFVFPP